MRGVWYSLFLTLYHLLNPKLKITELSSQNYRHLKMFCQFHQHQGKHTRSSLNYSNLNYSYALHSNYNRDPLSSVRFHVLCVFLLLGSLLFFTGAHTSMASLRKKKNPAEVNVLKSSVSENIWSPLMPLFDSVFIFLRIFFTFVRMLNVLLLMPQLQCWWEVKCNVDPRYFNLSKKMGVE